MTDVVIDNPILNSPFAEPGRHFRFGEEGITSEVVEKRRVSSYFMPIPAAKKRSQMHFDTEWTRDRIEENQFINQVRGKIGPWRRGGWPGVTPTTRRLLDHWTATDRERWKRRSISRRLRQSTATPGSPTSCSASPRTPTRACPVSR
jgi:type III restriction enzyme